MTFVFYFDWLIIRDFYVNLPAKINEKYNHKNEETYEKDDDDNGHDDDDSHIDQRQGNDKQARQQTLKRASDCSI